MGIRPMRIRPLQPSEVTDGFSCGEPALDVYFRQRAWSHMRDDVARVYVLEADDAGQPRARILGYYTLAARELVPDRVQGALGRSLPRYPRPVFSIGCFAVAVSEQGRGLGRVLMADALRRCAEGAAIVGAVGVLLDSLDARSTAFYRRLGFTPIPRDASAPASDTRQPMFLPMSVLRAAVPPVP